ncbi:hypothetical protein QBC37DRAFT_449745 [Rhypophila decipiens]|uniref:DUF6536 domain-containing protein n=1 Tax=Rhypophila decipiens TaxID=261697 RepID=A0AAN6Y0F4_9PEZI|nr:hypothetical protein QBC37DRAFT_449745 [Rhypophila decipiens]
MTMRHDSASPGGSVTVLSGPCQRVNRAKVLIQLAITAASLTLLAASNFAAQAWTALTREEIDRVHRSDDTVDIGIPSLRNMTHISLPRRILWLVIAISSSSSASDYTVSVLAREEFLRSFSTHESGTYPSPDAPQYQPSGHRQWENITLEGMVQRYGTGFADDYRSVILVAESLCNRETYTRHTEHPSRAVLYRGVMQTMSAIPQTRWLCDLFDHSQIYFDNIHRNATCRAASLTNLTRSEWKVNLGKIAAANKAAENNRPYDCVVLSPWALSERVELECRLISSTLFWWLATSSNILIAVLLAAMSMLYKSTPLVTVGDVIDSYLCTPSSDFGLDEASYDFTTFKNIYRHRPRMEGVQHHGGKKRRLWKAAGRTRWWLTVRWWLLVLFIVAAGFAQTWRAEKHYTDNSMAAIFSRGIDSLRRTSMVLPRLTTASSSTIHTRLQLVILANLPQLGMVVTYLLYNSLVTIMVVELEWNALATKPKSLRVSQPRKNSSQRGTLFLSLPYRFAVPLLLASGGLQWLVGQSLFFAEVDLWDEKGQRLGDEAILTPGYSHLALFWLLILGVLAWLPAVLTGFLGRLPTEGMPLLGSCSAVVAACSHFRQGEGDMLPEERLAAAGELLLWGASGNEQNDEGLGFSAHNIATPSR